MSFIFRRVHL